MDSHDVKYENLMRLLKEHGLDPALRGSGRKLAELLGITKQYASQLVSGKCPIGDNVIQRLCAVWGIDEGEFFQQSTKGGGQMAEDEWQTKFLFEQMSKRIDAQDVKIENLVALITRHKNEIEELMSAINGRANDLTIIRQDLAKIGNDITMLTVSVLSIKSRMIDAAKNNDVKCLGEPDAVNG